MNVKIEAAEAVMSFQTMLDAVVAGNRFTITVRGEPVAELVAVEVIRNANASVAVDRMLEFIRETPRRSVELRALRDEGRA
ncbi:hypothetical protein [Niveibacterium sp.]|uniref:hypothetical protein n=1 Tax=Niveibacterium sp. TaxID=2017444 RepID=UPI0035AFB2C0